MRDSLRQEEGELALPTIYYIHQAVANPLPEFDDGEGFLATVNERSAAHFEWRKEGAGK